MLPVRWEERRRRPRILLCSCMVVQLHYTGIQLGGEPISLYGLTLWQGEAFHQWLDLKQIIVRCTRTRTPDD